MKLFNSKLLVRLLALLLAFGMIAGFFAGCAQSDEDDDDDDRGSDRKDKDEQDDEDEDEPEGIAYTFNGLTYYLSEDFSDNQSDYSDEASHESDNATVMITGGPMDEVTGGGSTISNSQEFGEFFSDFMGDDVTLDTKNKVCYAVAEIDGEKAYVGFYIKGNYGWLIMATPDGDADEDELIDIVTSGKIDKNFDSGDSAPSTDVTPEPEVTPAPSGYRIYALVPDSWGTPGFWAWSNTTGENLFSAWPGESMYWDGEWYYMDVPGWVEYIIINGDGGNIQTNDEPIDGDAWVIVDQDGEYYEVFFIEPTADELSQFGY